MLPSSRFIAIWLVFCSLSWTFCEKINVTARNYRENGTVSITTVRTSTSSSITKGGNVSASAAAATGRGDGAKKWISQLMSEARDRFDMNELVTAKCKNDFNTYKQHLENQSIWAVRMLESAEWPSTGIYAGQVFTLGNWRECLRVSSNDITGKYCLVEANYDFDHAEYETGAESPHWPDERASVWNAIEIYKSRPWLVNRQKLTWPVCVPESCGQTDILNSLNRTLQPLFRNQGLTVSVTVDHNRCSTLNEPPYSREFYIVSGIFGIIVGAVILCTVFDCLLADENESNDSPKKPRISSNVIAALSAVQNYKQLTRIPSNVDESAPIYLMKVVYMLLVIAAHKLVFFLGYPRFESEIIERVYFNRPDTPMFLRGLMLIDVFITVSGFLNFHHGFAMIKKTGARYIASSIIFRWIKMVLVFVFVMLFVIYILPYTNQGPLWASKVAREVENCKITFWDNFFAVSNIRNTNNMCLIVSWYISVDIQLTILGCILMYIAVKSKIFGIIAAILTFTIAAIVTGVVAYANHYHALLPAYISFLEEPRDSEEFTQFYVATYTRIVPYLMGFAAAAIGKVLIENEYKISNKIVAFFPLFDFLSKYFLLMYSAHLFDFVDGYSRLENALGTVWIRIVFVLPAAVFLPLCVSNNFGSQVKLINQKIWIPLGRLLYSVFVTHTIVMLYLYASSPDVSPIHSYSFLMWGIISDTVVTFAASFLLYIFIEAPLHRIVILFLPKD